MYKVYMHTTPSGKRYIGITNQSVERRWKLGYGYKKSRYFYPAIKKYGWNNIKHEVLFTNLTKEEACKKEIELICAYNTNDRLFGYNLHEGGVVGGRPFGYHHTEETKKKLSERHKGKKLSKKQYETLKLNMFKKGHIPWTKGKKLPKQLVEKIRERCKGNKYALGHKLSEEQKKKISEASKGKHHSQKTEFKKGQTAWNKGVPMTKEKYEKCKATMFKKGQKSWNCGKKMTEEQKQKLRTAKRKTLKRVLCIETGIVFDKISDAGNFYKINHSTIVSVCKKRPHFKTAGGYHWKYVESRYE